MREIFASQIVLPLMQAEESNISLTFATIAKFLLILEGIMDSDSQAFPSVFIWFLC